MNVPPTARCPECDGELALRNAEPGKRVRCPHCRHVFRPATETELKTTRGTSLVDDARRAFEMDVEAIGQREPPPSPEPVPRVRKPKPARTGTEEPEKASRSKEQGPADKIVKAAVTDVDEPPPLPALVPRRSQPAAQSRVIHKAPASRTGKKKSGGWSMRRISLTVSAMICLFAWFISTTHYSHGTGDWRGTPDKLIEAIDPASGRRLSLFNGVPNLFDMIANAISQVPNLFGVARWILTNEPWVLIVTLICEVLVICMWHTGVRLERKWAEIDSVY